MIGSVGFIGLGGIGAPMARHLLDWPGGLVVYDIDGNAMEPFVAAGARGVSSVREVGQQCGVVSIMVRDDDQVRSVVAELLADPQPEKIIAVHSTVRFDTSVELASCASRVGVNLLDAPVTGGGVTGARDGTLVAMVGGDPAALERARPVFAKWSTLILHMGPAGAGMAAKLARNLLQFVSYVAAGEAQQLASAAGLDLTKLAAAVRHSDAVTGGPAVVMLRDNVDPLQRDDVLYPAIERLRALGEKDLDQALELGDQLGLDLPLTRLATQRLASSLCLPETDTVSELKDSA